MMNIEQEGWLDIFKYDAHELSWIKSLKKGNKIGYTALWGDGHEYIVKFMGYNLCPYTHKLSVEVMLASEELRFAYPYQVRSLQSHYRK
jgi:hypothetical protein